MAESEILLNLVASVEAGLDWMEAKMVAVEKMETCQEEMKARVSACQEAMKACSEKMRASQERLETMMKAHQEETEAVTDHSKWAPLIKAMHLLTTLKGQKYDVLHRAPKKVTYLYKETIGAVKDRSGDQQLVAVYFTQLKTRTQILSESPQEFAAAIEQMTHCVLLALHKHHISMGTGKVFGNDIRD
jgi:hypothetical protein